MSNDGPTCTNSPLRSIDWGCDSDGGTWVACTEHLGVVVEWMELGHELVRAGRHDDLGEPCAWTPQMTAEVIAELRAARQSARRHYTEALVGAV